MNPSDVIRNVFENLISGIHTAMPATIIDFDAKTCKATVQPSLNKKYLSGEVAFPKIENVPVIFPRGKDFFLTFPVQNNDSCLLIFSERSIDLWKSFGGQLTPDDRRKFDLSDAIAIPGLYSFNDVLEGVSGDDFVISYSGSKITIRKSGEISIETSNKIAIGNQTSELLDILSRLLGELSTSLTTAEATPIQGTVLYTTLKSEIDNLKGSI